MPNLVLNWSSRHCLFPGMIPHKTKRGAEAMNRLKVFDGIPPPHDKVSYYLEKHSSLPARFSIISSHFYLNLSICDVWCNCCNIYLERHLDLISLRKNRSKLAMSTDWTRKYARPKQKKENCRHEEMCSNYVHKQATVEVDVYLFSRKREWWCHQLCELFV